MFLLKSFKLLHLFFPISFWLPVKVQWFVVSSKTGMMCVFALRPWANNRGCLCLAKTYTHDWLNLQTKYPQPKSLR